MGGSTQGLDNVNREVPHSCWKRIFLLIGCQLASLEKVNIYHAVVAGVVGPHGCKYLTNGAEVLIERSLLDGIHLHGKNSRTDGLGKNLDEWNRVFDAFEVGGDVQPAA